LPTMVLKSCTSANAAKVCEVSEAKDLIAAIVTEAGLRTRSARERRSQGKLSIEVLACSPLGKCRDSAIEITATVPSKSWKKLVCVRAWAMSAKRPTEALLAKAPRAEAEVHLSKLGELLRSLVIHREMVYERLKAGRPGPYVLGQMTWETKQTGVIERLESRRERTPGVTPLGRPSARRSRSRFI
jgi:hypothetical protein